MLALLLACAGPQLDSDSTPVDVTLADTPDDHGSVACGTSCAGPDPSDFDHLEAELIPFLFEDWNQQPIGEPTEELETLLFYFQDTSAYLASQGATGLDAEHERFLREQLARDTVSVQMRVVEDDGTVRASLPAQDIPLKAKQHLVFDGTGSLGHLETGGKVKRVGLAHLWSRW
jgi:hypothetical protein